MKSAEGYRNLIYCNMSLIGDNEITHVWLLVEIGEQTET